MKTDTPIYFKSHINFDEIEIDKLYTSGSSIKYKHHVYKKFDLIVRLPVFKLDKYPVNDFKFLDPTNNSIDLKIPISQDQKSSSFGEFIKSVLKKFSNDSNLNNYYPNLNLVETQYIKIKKMEQFNYPIFNVDINTKSQKSIVKMNNPGSLSELKSLIKADYEILPFVQMKYTKINNKSFLTLVPIKFYVGKNLNGTIGNQITKNKKFGVLAAEPNVPYLNCNDRGNFIDSINFNSYLEANNENS
jgi:hypothetical protein